MVLPKSLALAVGPWFLLGVVRAMTLEEMAKLNDAGLHHTCLFPINPVYVFGYGWTPNQGPPDDFTVKGFWVGPLDAASYYDYRENFGLHFWMEKAPNNPDVVPLQESCDPSRFQNVPPALRREAGLLEWLQQYWVADDLIPTEDLWTRAWNRHGTCVSEYHPRCQMKNGLSGGSGAGDGPIQYFQDMRTMFQFHNLMNTLRANNILPVDPFGNPEGHVGKTSYPLEVIEDTITKHIGAKPQVICDPQFNSQLTEIRVYHIFDHQESSAEDVVRRAINSPIKSNCQTMVKFLDKSSGELHLLGRTPEAQLVYMERVRAIQHQHGSMAQYVVQELLRWSETNASSNGTEEAALTTAGLLDAPFDPSLARLLPNDFPYAVEPSIVHYVLWYRAPLRDSPALQSYLEAALPDHDVLFFINPPHLQSIRTIFHGHVFAKPRQSMSR